MPTLPTKAQLKRGAGGLSYRAQQLANMAILQRGFPVLFKDDIRIAITNAFIESALANARVLAYFLDDEKPPGKYLHFSHFIASWKHPVSEPTGPIIGLVSEYVAHALLGDPVDERHPGAWPIPELAVSLAAGLADFVSSLDTSESRYDIAWFTPNPAQTVRQLSIQNVLAQPTTLSKNEKVGRLTETLQEYLRLQGFMKDPNQAV